MLISSWVIIAYGVLLVVGDIADASLGLGMQLGVASGVPCWAVGLIIIAAGIASNQGRRSLRRTGFYVGIFVPISLAGLFLWRALPLWWSAQYRPAIGPTIFGFLGIAAVIAIGQLHPRSGIATRGYVVPIATRRPPPAETAEPIRRSEAG